MILLNCKANNGDTIIENAVAAGVSSEDFTINISRIPLNRNYQRAEIKTGDFGNKYIAFEDINIDLLPEIYFALNLKDSLGVVFVEKLSN